MDNRLTKKRMSNFLSYEWIAIILCIVAMVIVWELVYTMSAVRLTSGQQFKFFFDQNVRVSENSSLVNIFLYDDDEKAVFSYDVLEIGQEQLNSEYNVLNERLSIYDGDVIFTDSVESKDDKSEVKASRAKTIIDGRDMYTFDHLLEDGKNYLTKFLAEGKEDVFNPDNMDEGKIKAHFLARMKKDNRFRSEEEKKAGVTLEIERIKKLCVELEKFDYLINEYAKTNSDVFYKYTRYEYSYKNATSNKETYQKMYEREISEGRENANYGINLSALTGGEHNISEYLSVAGGGEDAGAKGVVLMAFDFYEVKDAGLYDLQFETVAYINRIVGAFSNIYSSRM